jgi:hypothetical protein
MKPQVGKLKAEIQIQNFILELKGLFIDRSRAFWHSFGIIGTLQMLSLSLLCAKTKFASLSLPVGRCRFSRTAILLPLRSRDCRLCRDLRKAGI